MTHTDVEISLAEGKNPADIGRILYMRRLTAVRQKFKKQEGKVMKTTTPYFTALCDSSFKLGKFHEAYPDDIPMGSLMKMLIAMWSLAAAKVLRHGGGSILQRALNAITQQN